MEICKTKNLKGGVNFQMRYSPNMLMAKQLLESGKIGTLKEIEVKISCLTPWETWTFLNNIPRMEVLYHSIHYFDVVRSFFKCEPLRVLSLSSKDPDFK